MSMYVVLLCELAKEGFFKKRTIVTVEEACALPLKWEILANTMRKYHVKLLLVMQSKYFDELTGHLVVHDLGANSFAMRFKLRLPSTQLKLGEAWVYCLSRRRWVKMRVPRVHCDQPRFRDVKRVEERKKVEEKVKCASTKSEVGTSGGEASSRAETTTSSGAVGGRKFVSISKIVYSQDPYVQRLIERLETEVTVLKQVVSDLKDVSESDRAFIEEIARRVEVLEREIERVKRIERELKIMRYQLARLMDAVQKLVEAYEVEVMRHA